MASVVSEIGSSRTPCPSLLVRAAAGPVPHGGAAQGLVEHGLALRPRHVRHARHLHDHLRLSILNHGTIYTVRYTAPTDPTDSESPTRWRPLRGTMASSTRYPVAIETRYPNPSMPPRRAAAAAAAAAGSGEKRTLPTGAAAAGQPCAARRKKGATPDA